MDDVMTQDAARVLGVFQHQMAELLRAGAGRTWSPASSWALVGELSGRPAPRLSQSTLSRIRRRIPTSSAENIARKVASRTIAHRYTVDSGALTPTASAPAAKGASAAATVRRRIRRPAV